MEFWRKRGFRIFLTFLVGLPSYVLGSASGLKYTILSNEFGLSPFLMLEVVPLVCTVLFALLWLIWGAVGIMASARVLPAPETIKRGRISPRAIYSQRSVHTPLAVSINVKIIELEAATPKLAKPPLGRYYYGMRMPRVTGKSRTASFQRERR